VCLLVEEVSYSHAYTSVGKQIRRQGIILKRRHQIMGSKGRKNVKKPKQQKEKKEKEK